MNTHVERARQIADALEAQDMEQTLHEQFVAEWKAWEVEDPTRTMADFDRAIGRVNAKGQPTEYTSQLVRLVTTPSARSEKQARTDRSEARRALRDPEQRKDVLASLPAEQVEDIAQAATEVAVERSRAKRAEHQTEPTTSDLMGPESFDPSEYWSDTLVIRVNRNARELASLIKRAGGLLFGTMPPEEAFDYLHEAERLIAEARAAAQEIVRDRTEV